MPFSKSLPFPLALLVLTVGKLVASETPEPASLAGVVLDPSRSTIPAARITVTPLPSGPAISQIANAEGRFAFRLPPGRYRITTTVDTGFVPDTRTVSLDAGDPAPPLLEIVLQVAENRLAITVTDSPGYLASAETAASLKSPVPLIDVPQSVTVLTGTQLRDQSMQSMADVVRFVPGITMAQGEGNRDAPVIRGNATTADFFRNGVRDDVQYFRDLYNVERVEAVKGANALTFGRGGGGGILNRVTKQAEFAPLREFSFQTGSFANRRFTSDLGHTFSPDAAIRLNTLYENSDGYRQFFGVERYGIAPAASFKLDPRSILRVEYEFFHDSRTADRGVPSFLGRPLTVPIRTFFGDPNQSSSTASVHLGSATIERQSGGWLIRNATVIADYDKLYLNVFPGAVNAGASQVSISGYDNATRRRNLFNQTDLTGTLFTGMVRHTLLAGAEFGRQSTSNLRRTAFFEPAGSATILLPIAAPSDSLPAAFRNSPTDADNQPVNTVAAAFVQDQAALGRYLQVVGGLRYDSFRLRVLDRRSGNTFFRPDHLVSPRLAVVFKPRPALSLYTSYSVTYLPSAGDQFASLNLTTQNLRPEQFHNYEAGLKASLSGRLAFTSAIYRLDRDNSTARDPFDPGIIRQTGRQRTLGAEASLVGSLTSRWQVAAAYSAQDAFVARTTTAAPRGARLPLVPRHSLSLWNNYRLSPRWTAGVALLRQTSLWAGIDNSVRLPGFYRADLASTYSLTEKIRLQAYVENVTGVTYFPTAHSNNNLMPGSPRALRASVLFRF